MQRKNSPRPVMLCNCGRTSYGKLPQLLRGNIAAAFPLDVSSESAGRRSGEELALQFLVTGLERFEMSTKEVNEEGGHGNCRRQHVDHGPEKEKEI